MCFAVWHFWCWGRRQLEGLFLLFFLNPWCAVKLTKNEEMWFVNFYTGHSRVNLFANKWLVGQVLRCLGQQHASTVKMLYLIIVVHRAGAFPKHLRFPVTRGPLPPPKYEENTPTLGYTISSKREFKCKTNNIKCTRCTCTWGHAMQIYQEN